MTFRDVGGAVPYITRKYIRRLPVGYNALGVPQNSPVTLCVAHYKKSPGKSFLIIPVIIVMYQICCFSQPVEKLLNHLNN